MARKGLGTGLSSLLGDDFEAAPPQGAEGAPGDVTRLGIDLLSPSPFQPRKSFDPGALDQLAASLGHSGMLQPILARPAPGKPGHYEIVAGERRWRAAQIARLFEVPVVIRELDDQATAEAAVLENVQREDLSAIEEAKGYQRLVTEFGYSAQELGESIGKSRSHVANLLRLLELPENVQKLVDQGKLSAGHARALIGLDQAQALAREVLEKGLSVRQLEARVGKVKEGGEVDGGSGAKGRQSAGASGAGLAGSDGKDADTRAAEKGISEALGLPVSLDHDDGKGSVTLWFTDFEQMDDLLRRLGWEYY